MGAAKEFLFCEGKAGLINFIDPEGAICCLVFPLLNTNTVYEVSTI